MAPEASPGTTAMYSIGPQPDRTAAPTRTAPRESARMSRTVSPGSSEGQAMGEPQPAVKPRFVVEGVYVFRTESEGRGGVQRQARRGSVPGARARGVTTRWTSDRPSDD